MATKLQNLKICSNVVLLLTRIDIVFRRWWVRKESRGRLDVQFVKTEYYIHNRPVWRVLLNHLLWPFDIQYTQGEKPRNAKRLSSRLSATIQRDILAQDYPLNVSQLACWIARCSEMLSIVTERRGLLIGALFRRCADEIKGSVAAYRDVHRRRTSYDRC